MSLLEFVSLGQQQIDGVPLRCVPLAAPRPAELFRRRLEAVRSSSAEYICFVDGGSDVCLPGFAQAMHNLAAQGEPLGYAPELVHGKPQPPRPYTRAGFIRDFTTIHHGVVCRVADLLSIDWPDGCYCWEVIAYGALAERGFAFDPLPRYDWRPGAGGARLWPGYARGVVNSLRWLQNLPGVHFDSDR